MTPARDKKDVVLFDLTGTVGRPVMGADGRTLERFEVYAQTRSLLERLQSRARLGLQAFSAGLDNAKIRRVMHTAGIGAYLDSELIDARAIVSPTHFAAMATRVGALPQACLFVSPCAMRRSSAVDAGFRVAPSAKNIEDVLDGARLTYVRMSTASGTPAAMTAAVGQPGIELLNVGTPGMSECYGFGMPSAPTHLAAAAATGVEELMSAEEAAVCELYLIQGDLDQEFVDSVRRRLRVVERTPAGLIIALPPDIDIGEFHPPRAGHGHTIRLSTAAPPPPPATAEVESNTIAAVAVDCKPAMIPSGTLAEADKQALIAQVNAPLIESFLHPLVGEVELPPPWAQTIDSRSIREKSMNQAAVEYIAGELDRILGNAETLPFPVRGVEIANVHGQITGSSCPDSLIIIGAHLDSTAAGTPGWKMNGGPAPGADDNASGVAAVLAAAEALAALSATNPPKRTIRFVLFNAEENTMRGSGAYVDDLRDLGTQHVVAMMQMDMIGVKGPEAQDPTAKPLFEIHPPGSADFKSVGPATIEQSTVLATILEALAPIVSPNIAAQRYPLPNCGDSDPVAWRSDHLSFILGNIPACDVSEERFVDVCGAGGQVPEHAHPGYHTANDILDHVDTTYVADIARVVAAAAWVIANGEAEVGPNALIATHNPQPQGGQGMSTLLVHFISDFLRDPELRCKVLKNDITGPQQYGLTDQQIQKLRSFDSQAVLAEVLAELKSVGIDLEAKGEEVNGGGGPAFAAMATLNLYSAGGIHPRRAVPSTVPANTWSKLIIAGNGFDKYVQIRFAKTDGTGTHVMGTVVKTQCDIDLYQRVEVEVNLPAGQWNVEARNDSNGEFETGTAGDPPVVVTAA